MALKRFTIGLPDDTYTTLKEQAERDHRTLGQQIAYLLEVYVPAYQKTMRNTFPSTFIPHDAPEGLNHSTPENPTGQNHTPTNTITNYTKSGKRTLID